MGCDIHFIIEEKTRDDLGWIGIWNSDYIWFGLDVEKLRIEEQSLHCLQDRHYTFFALLAGVRGIGPDPNGLPADMSSMGQRWNIENDDCHSRCHMSLKMFIMNKITALAQDIIGCDEEEGALQSYLKYIIENEEEEKRFRRVLISFDS